MNKKFMILSLAALGGVGIIGVTSAYAASTIGTVTGKDGDVKNKVQMEAEVVSQNGSHLTIKDTATGSEYQTAIGPSWYSGSYKVGDKVKIEGVETTGKNDNSHNFQVMKINDKTLRQTFEGKPAWAGQGRNGQGQGQHRNQNFVDTNGDGVCDNK